MKIFHFLISLKNFKEINQLTQIFEHCGTPDKNLTEKISEEVTRNTNRLLLIDANLVAICIII